MKSVAPWVAIVASVLVGLAIVSVGAFLVVDLVGDPCGDDDEATVERAEAALLNIASNDQAIRRRYSGCDEDDRRIDALLVVERNESAESRLRTVVKRHGWKPESSSSSADCFEKTLRPGYPAALYLSQSLRTYSLEISSIESYEKPCANGF